MDSRPASKIWIEGFEAGAGKGDPMFAGGTSGLSAVSNRSGEKPVLSTSCPSAGRVDVGGQSVDRFDEGSGGRLGC